MNLFQNTKTLAAIFGIVLLITALIIFLGDKDGYIEGKVYDISGAPIESVHIQIKGSSFKTSTDSKGKYLIDYVPGNFSIIYSKEGYVTHELELSLASKENFPAADVYLLPVSDKGISYITEHNKNIETLEENYPVHQKMRKIQLFSHGAENMHQYIFLIDHAGALNLPEGMTKFIVNVESEIQLFRIDPEFNILLAYEFLRPELINRYAYNGRIEGRQHETGYNRISTQSVNLKPGLYAWVQCEKFVNDLGQEYFKPMGLYYPFTVGQEWENYTIEMPKAALKDKNNRENPADFNEAPVPQMRDESIGYAQYKSENEQNLQTQGQTTNNQSQNRNTNQGNKTLIQDTGSLMQDFGETFSDFGEKRGGIIGKGFGLAGKVYSSVGSNLEGSDNDRSVAGAYSDSITTARGAVNSGNGNTTQQSRSNNSRENRPQKNIIMYSKGEILNKHDCIILLNHNDFDQVREAAKYVYYSDHTYDEEILVIVEQKLLALYKKNNNALVSDTLSWFCRILGNSGKTKYRGSLDKVAKNGSSFKLRGYASYNRDKLLPKTQKTSVNSDYEDKM